jgi:hypothetical protein
MGVDCSVEDFDYTIQLITSDVNILKIKSSEEIIIGDNTITIK